MKAIESNKEKFLNLVSSEKTETLNQIMERNKQRELLHADDNDYRERYDNVND